MKVYLYPGYNNATGDWCCILRDDHGHNKVISDKEDKSHYIYLHLIAIREGLKAVKISGDVDVIIYTHLKVIQAAINDRVAWLWKRNNWLDSDYNYVANHRVWKEIVNLLEDFSSFQVVRCLPHQNEFFEKAQRLVN